MSDKREGRSKGGRPETPVHVRMAGQVRESDNGCLEWLGGRDKDGYGVTSIRRKGIRAHRAAWIVANGRIPDGMCVCHRCDNPPCVNIEHLFLGSIAENNHDRHKKGRTGRGNARFFPKDVLRMRELSSRGESYSAIGRAFKTSATTVRSAVLGITWKNLKEGIVNGN